MAFSDGGGETRLKNFMHITYDRDRTPNVMRRTFRDDGHHGKACSSRLRSTHSESVGGDSHVEGISVKVTGSQQQARLRSTRPAHPVRISARPGLAMRG